MTEATQYRRRAMTALRAKDSSQARVFFEYARILTAQGLDHREIRARLGAERAKRRT